MNVFRRRKTKVMSHQNLCPYRLFIPSLVRHNYVKFSLKEDLSKIRVYETTGTRNIEKKAVHKKKGIMTREKRNEDEGGED